VRECSHCDDILNVFKERDKNRKIVTGTYINIASTLKSKGLNMQANGRKNLRGDNYHRYADIYNFTY
jgi:hypothetical protein